jgi:hypothetical protein
MDAEGHEALLRGFLDRGLANAEGAKLGGLREETGQTLHQKILASSP